MQPFAVTAWSGSSPAAAPADLRPALVKADSPGETTYFLIVDCQGRVVRTIPGGTMRTGRTSEATAYVKEQLEKAVTELKLPAGNGKLRAVRLPDVESVKEKRTTPAGVRLLVRLSDHERAPYRVPVAKAVAMTEADWKSLAFPKEKREVPADAMKTWLTDVFPPAMMEMVGPNIRNEEVTGTLTFQPAGADKKFRYALLSGEVRLVLAGRTKVTHTGKLQALLQYPLSADQVGSMQAVFDGVYPETDPKQQRTVSRKYVAVIESRPE